MNYEEAGMILLKESGVVIKKWRTSMSGRAWYKENCIACPKPKTAKSFEIFAHEVGHMVANPNRKAPSWLREIQAIEYSRKQFERFGLELPTKVKKNMMWYGAYSICQALNRGMKHIPEEGKMYRTHIKRQTVTVIHGNGDRTYKKVWRAI